MSSSLVEQLGAALDPVSAAAAPLVGDAWREVPAYTLFFAAIFAAALLLWVSLALGLQPLLAVGLPHLRALLPACQTIYRPRCIRPAHPTPQYKAAGVEWRKAAVLSSCSMSSVHGLLAALGALLHCSGAGRGAMRSAAAQRGRIIGAA